MWGSQGDRPMMVTKGLGASAVCRESRGGDARGWFFSIVKTTQSRERTERTRLPADSYGVQRGRGNRRYQRKQVTAGIGSYSCRTRTILQGLGRRARSQGLGLRQAVPSTEKGTGRLLILAK